MADPSSQDSPADFVDVRIVDLDLARTTWSRVHDSLRVMFLRLDRDPPDNEWIRLFFEERQSRIVALRRGLWIEDGCISFDASPDEVENIHLPDIRRSVDYANRRFREVVAQRRRQRDDATRDLREERAALLALQARVRVALRDGNAAAAPFTPPVKPVPIEAFGFFDPPTPAATRLEPINEPIIEPVLPERPVVANDAGASVAPATSESSDMPAPTRVEPLDEELDARRRALREFYRAATSRRES
jgi:hypothetical protein